MRGASSCGSIVLRRAEKFCDMFFVGGRMSLRGNAVNGGRSRSSTGPTTHASVLLGVGVGVGGVSGRDDSGWGRFEAVYRPFVIGYARHRGMQDADSDEVLQHVLVKLVDAMNGFTYYPSRSFRSCLRSVTENRIRDLHERARRLPKGGGGTAAQEALAGAPAP